MEGHVLHDRRGRCAMVSLNQKLVKHVHSYPQLIMCLDGAPAIYRSDNAQISLRPHQMVVVPAWREHSCEPSSSRRPSHCLAIHLNTDWLDEGSIGSLDLSHRVAHFNPKLGMSLRHIIESTEPADRDVSGEFGERLVDLLSDSDRRTWRLPGARDTPVDFRIRKACAYMNENLHAAWDLGQIARHCAMSRPHFNFQFKAVMGTTPAIYANELRMRKATRLLCGPARLSISEISEAIGFSASANFIRFFRNHVGLSPNRFRLSFRTVA